MSTRIAISRPGRSVAVGAALLLALAACSSSPSASAPDTAPTPTATPTPTPAPGKQYVALGSSFGAGPGVPVTTDAGCARSSGNYAHLVADARKLQLTDVTCSSATSDNLVRTEQGTSSGPRPPQVSAVDGTTQLVTVTVGGNDVNYIGDLYRNSCSPPNNAMVPPVFKGACGPPDTAKTRAALRGVQAKLVGVVQAIRMRAPNARIVLVDYVTILPQDAKPCRALPLTTAQISYSLDVARRLQLATQQAAQQTGAQLVELSKASLDHDVCSSDPWVTGWTFGPDFLTGGVVPYHPNAEGMRAAADLVAARIT